MHHDHDHDGHSHKHHSGFKGWLFELFVPHTHDSSDSIDDALEASKEGVRALKVSLVILLGTTLLQFAIVTISGSVALLTDNIHNFADALTAVPLWIAFILGRRMAAPLHLRLRPGRRPRRVVHRRRCGALRRCRRVAVDLAPVPPAAVAQPVVGGRGRADRVCRQRGAGRLPDPGRAKIGSAPWWPTGCTPASTVHLPRGGVRCRGRDARIPLADPIVGLLISAAIIVLLWGTVKSIGRRLMDGSSPSSWTVPSGPCRDAGRPCRGQVQLRWVGHRLQGAATIAVADAALSAVAETIHAAEHRLGRALPELDDMVIRAVTAPAREKGTTLEPSHTTTIDTAIDLRDGGHPRPWQFHGDRGSVGDDQRVRRVVALLRGWRWLPETRPVLLADGTEGPPSMRDRRPGAVSQRLPRWVGWAGQ